VLVRTHLHCSPFNKIDFKVKKEEEVEEEGEEELIFL